MTQTSSQIETAVPMLWLLGKTGAGKTSLVRALTGEGRIGSGFAPGTRGLQTHDFPTAEPAVRFLDTRGLGEAGYDPAPDLAVARSMAHAVLAVVRMDDPVQAPLVDALRAQSLPVLVVFTGGDLLRDPLLRARARAEFRARVGRDLPSVTVGMPETGLVTGIEDLLDALDSFVPHAAAMLRKADEARAFARIRPMVLRYAAAAGASDALPLAGTATVPAAQGAMLRTLARHHGVELTRARLALLASALGTGALVRLAAGHLLRQGVKLVPVAGQTLGAAAAAGTSFATTYALGRAASAWLHGVARGAAPDPAALRKIYEQALKGARDEPR